MQKITPTNCLDCAMERKEYGTMYCPVHYMLSPDIGDSLYNNIDKKLYLISMIDYKKKTITLTDIQNNKINILNNAKTLSNFKLIKSHD